MSVITLMNMVPNSPPAGAAPTPANTSGSASWSESAAKFASPIDPAGLEREFARLVDFGRRFGHPAGGAAWLDAGGRPDLTQPIHTWITARMLHIYSLAALRGVPGGAALAETALRGLTGPLRDPENRGWYSCLGPAGPSDEKSCYAHAFVVLGAASAAVAGIGGGAELLAEALAVWESRFWDPNAQMYFDRWNLTFTELDDYRGLNANMHAVEALLAAADATADSTWLSRAETICRRVVNDFAAPHSWRIPEHFTSQWQPVLDFNRDRPDDPFKPFGATVGHALEWSRLLLQVAAATAATAKTVATASTTAEPGCWLRSAATALFDRAVVDGWAVDGAAGFVYTTDFAGQPVVRDRMHWVVAEGISAASALYRATGESRFAQYAQLWWDYVQDCVIDAKYGSWHHQLDPSNSPLTTVWPGKPDIYHAVQAMLIPRLPLTPGLAVALKSGLLPS